MYKPISLFISFRYLWNFHLPKFKKFIVFLSIIGITISTTSLIIIISIINGSEENFQKNILSFIPHLIITNKNKYINKMDFPKNFLQLRNIENICELVSKEVVIKNKNDITMAEIIGIDSTNYNNVRNYSIQNISDLLKPKHYNIIIGKHLAEKINVNIGDKVQLILLSDEKNFFLEKIFNQHIFKVADIFSTKNEVDYYQILINKEDSLNFLKYSKNYITGWRVWFKNPLYLDLNEIKKTTNQLVLLDWKLQKGELFKAMKIEKYIMLFLFFLILLISIFNIFTNLTIFIIEKYNTIAILKTQGLLNWKIMLIFIIFGSSTTIIGNLLGTIISIILILQNDFLKFVLDIFFKDIDLLIVIKLYQIFFINIISIFLAILTTLYPSFYAIRLEPSEILSNE